MSDSEASVDAVVVGAGAAGLMAARELKHAGKRVLILEASNRVGGRVITLYDTNAGVPVELGAEFVHGDAVETTRLCDEAHLVMVPVLGEQYRSDRGQLSPLVPAWQRMNRVFRYMNPKRKHDRSFQEFLDEKPGGRGLTADRELARGFVQGFFAADPKLVSEKWIAVQGNPTEGAAESRRIVNGYAALIDYLKRDVDRNIRFNALVERISWNERGVRVYDQVGREYRARAVILAVPLPILEDPTFVMEPETAILRRAAHDLVMGHVMRVNLVMKERFWEKKVQDLSFLQTPTRPFNVWWTHSPLIAPLITGWSGGPPAMEFAEVGNIEDAAIRELSSVFRIHVKRVESLVDSIHTYDWTHDPNIRGAYSYARVGGAFAARTLARNFGGTIFLAGEATDSGSSGTVEGALVSGKRAAAALLRGDRRS
ncbi:MAG: flavin monoamine oxidase family protein [Gemmatimonadaceae bacterium]